MRIQANTILVCCLLPFILIGLHFSSAKPVKSVALDHVAINEVVVKGTEYIELYNPTGSPVDLTGWTLQGSINFTTPYTFNAADWTGDLTGDSIDAGGYIYSSDSAFDLNDDGEYLMLNSSSTITVDAVGYGFSGGAPLPHNSWSMIRLGVDNDDDAADWDITNSITLGTTNTGRYAPNLGGGNLIINEVDMYPATDDFDKIELLGSASSTYHLWLSNGDVAPELIMSVQTNANGFLALNETVDFNFDISSHDVIYLWKDEEGSLGARIDQCGFYGGYEDGSYQRYPDGTGTNDGYDIDTSTGFVDADPTWGASNTDVLSETNLEMFLLSLLAIGIPAKIIIKKKKF